MFNLNDNILVITLPEGMTQVEILELAKAEFSALETLGYGKDIKVSGRLTTSLAMWLGHKLAHISKSVSLFDPKENGFVGVIKHQVYFSERTQCFIDWDEKELMADTN